MLDKKYRPKDLKYVYGNKTMLKSLVSVLPPNRDIDAVPKCFLFCGGPGCGKTTLSRIVAGMLDTRERNATESPVQGSCA